MPRTSQQHWAYDGSIDLWPMRPGELWDCGLGKVMVRDLYDGMPAFMTDADCIFVDLPYNRGLEQGYRTKAGLPRRTGQGFELLPLALACFKAINPATCFVEIGRQNVTIIERGMSRLYPHVTTYPATYYRRHPCFVVRGGREPPKFDYAGLDETEIVSRICSDELFEIIADPCMGRGWVGREAFRLGRKFRGTELNAARLAVMVNAIHQLGGHWEVDGVPFAPP